MSRVAAGRGRAGERAAAGLVAGLGWSIVGRGFVARRGEIDLVCRDGDRLVVVEVKARSSELAGAPLEAVGERKRRSLRRAASEYRVLAGWRGPVDFAVVEVKLDGEGRVLTADLVDL